jgi:tyrosine-protein kinase Etk/Wzc
LEDLRNNPVETIDFGKLKATAWNNLLWIILILAVTNSISILYVRYTQAVYESESELKLDVKEDASELGIREMAAPDKNLNLISGEIETIQSKLFLNTVIDSLDLQVSYLNIGNILTEELYKSSPFIVKFISLSPSLHNVPFFIEQKNSAEYELSIADNKSVIHGTFNEPVTFHDATVLITLQPGTELQNNVNYSFVYNSREKLLDYLARNLNVEPINFNAKTIRVSFVDSNPMKAHDLVNSIDSLYLQFSNYQKNLATKQKIAWLNNEMLQIEGKMGNYEDYFEDFTLKNKTSDLNADLRLTILQIHRIDSQRFELSRRITEINQFIDNIAVGDFYLSGVQLKELPAAIQQYVEQLQPLVIEMDRIRLSYNESTLAYQQKENKVQSIKNALFKELTAIKSASLKRLQQLNNSKSKLEEAFANMPDKNTQFNKNQRFYKLYEEFYLTLMQHKSEFEIAQAGSTPDFKILSAATLPGSPIAPKKLVIYSIGLISGIVINIFLIGILYLANNKITNTEDVERLTEVPMLGAVPRMRKQSNAPLYILEYPKSIVSEGIRTLRTNLDFFNAGSTKKVIAISSTVSGEGKSFIALNLGGIMALSRKKVVLLDVDMRKPKKSPFTTEESSLKGMSTILIRKNTWQECIVKTPIENLHIIPSGPQPPNPSELLMNGEFTGLLEELRKHYDLIVLDTPPIGLVTDGLMAIKNSDISIYVFRANYSKKDFLKNLQRVLKINKFTNVITVLNAQPPLHEGYYGSGYYQEEGITKRSGLLSFFKRA